MKTSVKPLSRWAGISCARMFSLPVPNLNFTSLIRAPNTVTPNTSFIPHSPASLSSLLRVRHWEFPSSCRYRIILCTSQFFADLQIRAINVSRWSDKDVCLEQVFCFSSVQMKEKKKDKQYLSWSRLLYIAYFCFPIRSSFFLDTVIWI